MSGIGMSDYLRIVSRNIPFSLPPLEGSALVLLMLVWLFG